MSSYLLHNVKELPEPLLRANNLTLITYRTVAKGLIVSVNTTGATARNYVEAQIALAAVAANVKLTDFDRYVIFDPADTTIEAVWCKHYRNMLLPLQVGKVRDAINGQIPGLLCYATLGATHDYIRVNSEELSGFTLGKPFSYPIEGGTNPTVARIVAWASGEWP